jgi:Family of unknown function (DUF5761)
MATQFWPNPLSDAFFSDFNRESIHQGIIDRIKQKTGYTIDKQNDADLQALMKRVYVNLMGNPYGDVLTQVKKMNSKVIDEATTTISTGMLQQILYLRDISSNPVPLQPPVSTSTYGNKIPSNFKIGF